MNEFDAKVGIAGIAIIGALVTALIKIVHARNGRAKQGWSKDLMTYIDERAAHKAANAAAPVLMEVGNVRRDLAQWKGEAGERFDKMEGKIDNVSANVGRIGENVARIRGRLDDSAD